MHIHIVGRLRVVLLIHSYKIRTPLLSCTVASHMVTKNVVKGMLSIAVSSLTSQVNEMKAMMTFFVQNYQGELPHDFPVFHSSSVSDQGSVPNGETNDSDQD
ncbi:hypothetical protein DEO72_LG7g1445 [Vigna unguiculata]|uniref:Uncharacterized protein n=1 Tax=Vigna unguiculata TaxID=3917 RepID=A0A4D6MGL5_VIGUN|nr:hypothetical protein DEO72_LG7g1445 [Vigna unguiculata]